MSTIEEAIKRKKLQQLAQTADTEIAPATENGVAIEQSQDKELISKTNIPSDKSESEKVAESKEVSSLSKPKETIELNAHLLGSKNYLVFNPDHESDNLASTKEQLLLKEEFRQIKRKLLNNAFGVISKTIKNSNLVMVTSSQANEGKTFISINLALSIALEQDKTVMLVDADVLKPSIPSELGFTQKRGLLDYLNGKIKNLADVIHPTSFPNLKILPAGTPHHLSNELLASEKMASLCQELQQRYPDRIVLFDCPPLLGINETSVLAQLMGQALLVVEENHSSLEEIKKANELLPDTMAKGAVLNKAIYAPNAAYGYYGYGYGYGYGSKKA
ncbi:XrtA-associated tyrosine autokinase [Thalassotalea aquiviva]|uniref:XrtA-associated tyrosine autokinase n=1 Tax=Thalassotalea aquiviva TaxID=3242415 RepID=UPI00352B0C0F